MYIRILFLLIVTFLSSWSIGYATAVDLNVRKVNVEVKEANNTELEQFKSPISNFFFPVAPDGTSILDGFIVIAYNIKNFFIAIAVIFLIIGVIKLLFSSNSEEDLKKWRRNIVWTSVGILVMQIAYSVWNTLRLTSASDKIGSSLGWSFWVNIFGPIVDLLQILASFGFLLMAIYAFYILVTAGGDEERTKKGKNIVIYAIIGFLLIRIPYWIVRAIYGKSPCENTITIRGCDIRNPNPGEAVSIVATIFKYFNTFLALICVALVIYAAWLVLISAGDEEKIKKAKNIVIYIIVGFLLLVASHALFRFFLMPGSVT